jgi:hypothetical protein
MILKPKRCTRDRLAPDPGFLMLGCVSIIFTLRPPDFCAFPSQALPIIKLKIVTSLSTNALLLKSTTIAAFYTPLMKPKVT